MSIAQLNLTDMYPVVIKLSGLSSDIHHIYTHTQCIGVAEGPAGWQMPDQ